MASSKFTLTAPLEGHVTTALLPGGEVLTINRGSKKISVKGSPYDGLETASSEDLQRIYDSGPQYQTMITAPKGHSAPWQKDAKGTPAPKEEDK